MHHLTVQLNSFGLKSLRHIFSNPVFQTSLTTLIFAEIYPLNPAVSLFLLDRSSTEISHSNISYNSILHLWRTLHPWSTSQKLSRSLNQKLPLSPACTYFPIIIYNAPSSDWAALNAYTIQNLRASPGRWKPIDDFLLHNVSITTKKVLTYSCQVFIKYCSNTINWTNVALILLFYFFIDYLFLLKRYTVCYTTFLTYESFN